MGNVSRQLGRVTAKLNKARGLRFEKKLAHEQNEALIQGKLRACQASRQKIEARHEPKHGEKRQVDLLTDRRSASHVAKKLAKTLEDTQTV